jgi:membrane-bound lytic murein transglycosylase B
VVAPIVFVAVLIAAVVGAYALFNAEPDRPRNGSGHPSFVVVELNVPPGSSVPAVAPIAPGERSASPRPTSTAVQQWAATLAERTQIPERSLVAYAEAELAVRETTPACNLTWATLAGVGRIESHHGNYGGSRVGDDGQLSPPIIGIPLDGSPGVRAVQDTDGGQFDGDVQWDRAVGLMQFLPETWDRWSQRASGDGQAPDPQNVDDAALTAARYLCASGGDLATPAGWWDAVLTYNQSVPYGQNVYSGADAYAKEAAKIS